MSNANGSRFFVALWLSSSSIGFYWALMIQRRLISTSLPTPPPLPPSPSTGYQPLTGLTIRIEEQIHNGEDNPVEMNVTDHTQTHTHMLHTLASSLES